MVFSSKLKTITLAISVAMGSATLIGCGGGGGGGSNVRPDPPADTGDFSPPIAPTPPPVDSPPIVEEPSARSSNLASINAQEYRDSGFTGEGADVIVLDNGLLDKESVDFSVKDGEVLNFGYTSSGDLLEPTDHVSTRNGNRHGEEIAAIIGSATAGIAPDVTMTHGLVIVNEFGEATTEGMVRGIDYAVDQQIDFVNLSIGYGGIVYLETDQTTESIEDNYILSLYSYGVGFLEKLNNSDTVVIQSAGNHGRVLETYKDQGIEGLTIIDEGAPENVLIVGGVLDSGEIAPQSARPGKNESVQARFLLGPMQTYIVREGQKTLSYGTSGAAAAVTGGLSLVKSRWNNVSNKDIANIALNTARRDFDGYDVETHGQGIFDLERMMKPMGNLSMIGASNEPVPMMASMVTMPAGFEAVSYEQTFFDSYNRDFVATFNSQSRPYQSQLHVSMQDIGQVVAPRQVPLSEQLVMGFVEQPSTHFVASPSERNFVELGGLADNLFGGRNQSRLMQGMTLSAGDYMFGFSANIRDNFDGVYTNQLNESGYVAQAAYRDLLRVDVFQSQASDVNEPLFFGANTRDFQAIRASIHHSGLFAGFEQGVEQFNGTKGIFTRASIESRGVFLGYATAWGERSQWRAGVMGRSTDQTLNLEGRLTGSVGNGDTFSYNANLTSTNRLQSAGAYLSGEKLHASVFVNDFDQGGALVYSSSFTF